MRAVSSAASDAKVFHVRLTDQFATTRDSSVGARFPLVWVLAGIVATLLSIYQLDRLTGEAPVQHLYYLPILLAAVYIGRRAGLAAAIVAIILYHRAQPAPHWPVRESDVVQIILFLAVAVVTARLADDARRLRQLAATDDLTGLHNLRSFESRVMSMVHACRRARLPIAMLVLDLDRLKAINDVHGHLAGSDAVRLVGHVLAARLPKDAVACRFGGDEFVVAIPDCATVSAEAIADDIRGAVKALAPRLGAEVFPAGALSVSVGVACLLFGIADSDPALGACDGAIEDGLFRVADRSLYFAKEQGRDRVSVATLSTAAMALPQ